MKFAHEFGQGQRRGGMMCCSIGHQAGAPGCTQHTAGSHGMQGLQQMLHATQCPAISGVHFVKRTTSMCAFKSCANNAGAGAGQGKDSAGRAAAHLTGLVADDLLEVAALLLLQVPAFKQSQHISKPQICSGCNCNPQPLNFQVHEYTRSQPRNPEQYTKHANAPKTHSDSQAALHAYCTRQPVCSAHLATRSARVRGTSVGTAGAAPPAMAP